MLFFQAFILSFPPLVIEDRGDITVHVSAKGIAFPWPHPQETSWLFASFVIVSFFLSRWIFKWRVKILDVRELFKHGQMTKLVKSWDVRDLNAVKKLVFKF